MREPGFYDDIPEDEYHADPDSLSVSGAKLLLQAPALFDYRRDHPEHREEFDIGSAAHQLVLGRGPEIVEVEADDWRSADARRQRDEAYELGQVPLLSKDLVRVHEMADALSSHAFASSLLDGSPEVSVYAFDEPTGVLLRGRIDSMSTPVLVDYKTAASAHPDAFAAAVARFGYDMQAAWYLDLCAALGEPREGFGFVVQEKTPPYLVEVYQLDELGLERGELRNRRAIDIYRRCVTTNKWPGYTGRDYSTLSLPRWALIEEGL